MNDLLELVGECVEAGKEAGDIEAAIAEANSLKDLGFNTAAAEIMVRATRKGKLNRIAEQKYVVITNEKIEEFLRRKAAVVARPTQDRFDRFMGGFTSEIRLGKQMLSADIANSVMMHFQRQAQLASESAWFSLTAQSIPSTLAAIDARGDRWVWNEVPVADYKAIPPKDVLVKMAEHKARGCFDSFTIASVEKIHDPLLLGRIEGVLDRRWYIAQWGDDVSLDDVI